MAPSLEPVEALTVTRVVNPSTWPVRGTKEVFAVPGSGPGHTGPNPALLALPGHAPKHRLERLAPLLGREHRHRGRESVEEVAAADRADLPRAEEAARRGAEDVLDRRRIVIRHVEHVGPAAVAGEDEGTGRPFRPQRRGLRAQRLAQVLVRRGAVAHV